MDVGGLPLWAIGAVAGGVLVFAGFVLLLVLSGRRRGAASAAAAPARTTRQLPPDLRLIAVVPFRTDSDRPDLAAFSAGLTALVRRHLFCVHGLSVLTAEDTPGGEWSEIRELFTRAGREALLVAKLSEGPGGLCIDAAIRRPTSVRAIGPEDAPFDAQPLGPYEAPFEDLHLVAERIARDAGAALGVAADRSEQEAIEACRPARPPSVMRLGMAMTVGQVGRATELLEQAIQDDRGFALTWVELARVVGDTNPERAAALLEQAIELDPHHAVPFWELAMLYIFRFSGRSSAALELSEKALDLAPGFGQARILHGNFLGLLGRSAAEAEERKIAVRLLPGNPHAWANEGKVLAREGDVAGALAAFEKALALDRGHPDALEGIVPVAHKLGRHADVLRWAERRMEVENPLVAGRPGDEGGGDEGKFLRAAEEAIAAAGQLGDRVALERVAKKALAVDADFRPAKKALAS